MKSGVVVIGRNEGQRLVRCLESLRERSDSCVYVDSGSTDGSVAEARRRGIMVLPLDMTRRFTAARARNAGFRALTEKFPDLHYVHFIDGDCEVQAGWVAAAERFLDDRRDVAVVFGIQKERHPERSIYNTLFDVEWDTPRGEALSCAGNSACRCEIFARLGGFREDLIAGEDPEFCVRVRAAGAKVWHLDTPMVLHDADMLHWSQWWKRSRRAGYAFAEGAALHGRPPERHFMRERRSMLIWGVAIPLLVLIGAILTPWALLALFVYPLQIYRVARRGQRSARINRLYAIFVVLAKFPEAAGCITYFRDRLGRRQQRLIEYK